MPRTAGSRSIPLSDDAFAAAVKLADERGVSLSTFVEECIAEITGTPRPVKRRRGWHYCTGCKRPEPHERVVRERWRCLRCGRNKLVAARVP